MNITHSHKISPLSGAKRAGFTLIELSIVLVIIGLIIGGVLVGRDLIQASKIRETISQSQEYVTVVNTFKLKYNCMPGDCPNAYDFFGADCGANSNHPTNGCNGDGDKSWINWQGNVSDAGDGRKTWTHLGLAEMIDNSWRSPDRLPGIVTPTPLGSFTMWTFTTMDATHNTLRLSSPRSISSPHSYGQWGAISGPIAHDLDVKVDDGQANSGKVIGRNGLSTACLSGSNYDMRNDDIRCLMYFNYF